MSKDGTKKLRGLLKNIKKLEVGLPKKADDKYFADLEDKIMKNIGLDCQEVKESLVDFCEGTLSEARATEIKNHMESCDDCMEEYTLTVKLMFSTDQVDTREEKTDDYFATLADKITEKAFEGMPTDECDKAQEYIVNLFMDESIPSSIQAHLDSCEACKKETKQVERIVLNLKKLSVPLPNEQYFDAQLKRIDAIIEMMPSPHKERSESRERIANYLSVIVDTFRTTIMQPQAAIAVSALVALLIIGGKMYYSHDNIEEKQISLSEVISKTNTAANGVVLPSTDADRDRKNGTMQIDAATAAREKYMNGSISDPKEDEKLELKTTGTAEVKNKNKKLN